MTGRPARFEVCCIEHRYFVEVEDEAQAQELANTHNEENFSSDPCWARTFIHGDEETVARCFYHGWTGTPTTNTVDAIAEARAHNAARNAELARAKQIS